MTTPYHADEWLTVLEGDCRDVLATLPAESVHCVVTSPPYWGLRDYGTPGQLGLEATPEDYVAAMVDVFRAVRRVLRADGTVWLNLGDSYNSIGGTFGSPKHAGPLSERVRQSDTKTIDPGLKPKDLVGIPWRVAFALQADGWYLRSDIVWSKPNPMPESVTDRPTKSHEYVFLLAKSARYFFDADAVRERGTTGEWSAMPPIGGVKHPGNNGNATYSGNQPPSDGNRNIRSVWHIATAPYPGAHFATFPPKLVEPCVKAGCPIGGVVLDPFAGTGTVGLVAASLSRRAILVDLNAEYLRQCLARNRQMPLGVA